MAELVDALASGASGSNAVRVQISQWAPSFNKYVYHESDIFCGVMLAFNFVLSYNVKYGWVYTNT